MTATTTSPRDRACDSLRWARSALDDARIALTKTAHATDERIGECDRLLYALIADLATGADR